MTVTPTNGVDRCPCGCKYWSGDLSNTTVFRCFDCGDRFDPRDVHTEHCCAKHGCKYGVVSRTECTVESGEKPQSFPCETCDFVREQVAIYLTEATDEELYGEVVRRGLRPAFMPQATS